MRIRPDPARALFLGAAASRPGGRDGFMCISTERLRRRNARPPPPSRGAPGEDATRLASHLGREPREMKIHENHEIS